MSFWNWFNRGRKDRELDEEIRAHLAIAIRERIERGEDPQAAESAARREFGNRTMIAETTREIWGMGSFERFWQDGRYALRGMRRSPHFTAVAILSLALGIGANTAIFSLMYAVMLRALPVTNPEELVELLQKYPGEPRGNGYWTWKSYEHYRDHNQVFSALTGMAIDNRARLEADGVEPATGIAEYVIGNYFPELGIRPATGRLIGPDHNATTADGAVAVISWSMWVNRFHQDPNILGKKIKVNDAPATIIGVTSREYTGLRVNAQTDIWLPAKPTMGLALIGRLKPGVNIEQARVEMAALFRFTIEERAAKSSDPQVRQLKLEIEPCGTGLSGVRDRIGKQLWVLMAVVAVLLLLACANMASMLLARGAGRAREMALRLGLGASRGRLVRQVLTESVLLSLAGALAGAIVAYFGTALLLRIMDSGREHERLHLQVSPDGTILLFAAGIAILTGLLFGLAPALNAFRATPVMALRQSGRAVETRVSRIVGRALLSAQVALSVLLLSTAGLFVIHLANLKQADLGFRRDNVLLVSLDPSRSGYRGERLSGMYQELLNRMNTVPGVRSAAISGPTPLQGAGASGFATVEGFYERPEDRRWISISYVSPKYFHTLGVPLLAGREFEFRDRTNRVAIINRTLARQYFEGRDPIGKRITMDHVTLTREPATYEIIGVADDANYMEIREPARRGLYLPAFRDERVIANTFVISTNVEPRSLAPDVRRVLNDTAPGIAVARMLTLTDQIDASIVPERMMATLSGFFAVMGALLAGIGVYGLLAYTVARRTNEIGVRIALGATAGGVIRMVLQEALTIVAVGVMVGVPMAIWGRNLAGTLIRDLTSHAPTSFALGVAAIIAVGIVAAYVPAQRAARVDPMESLRQE
jgi:predicted permease